MSKRLSWYVGLTALLAAVTLGSQAQPLTGGLLGRPTADYAYIPAPPGCASGLVPYFNSSLQLVCSPTVYAPSTDTTTATGTIAARNLTATALATPVITPPVSPVLSLLTTVTVVAGASLVDGDYFTLSDGSAVVYEFDNDASVTSGRVGITFAGTETAQEIRDLVIIAINGSTLEATAIAAAADTLTVTSGTAGDPMGVNSENVANAGFLVPAWAPPTAATTYGYKVVAYLPDGTSTVASAEVTTAAGHATLSNANYNSVTWGAVTGAATYKLYRTTGGAAPPKLIYTGALLNFSDIGATGTAETPASVGSTGKLTGAMFGPNVTGTNQTASSVTHIGPLGTGTGTAGSLIFQVGTPQASGATAHVPATALTLTNIGTSGSSDPNVVIANKLSFGTLITLYASAGPELFFGSGLALSGTAAMRMPSSMALGWSASSTSNGNDTILTRGGAPATLQLGAANSATPEAQKLRVQGGTGTNIAGQRWDRQGSLATGTADSGAIVDRTGYTAGATTTQHVYSDRSGLFARWTPLTAGAATGFATLTYGASTSIGAEFFVTIRAGDGTNRQAMSYRVAVNSVRDATGNTQSVVAVIGTPPVAAGSGTLTAAFTVTEGAGAVTINCNAVSSLTETFLDANFQTIANGPGLTIAPL